MQCRLANAHTTGRNTDNGPTPPTLIRCSTVSGRRAAAPLESWHAACSCKPVLSSFAASAVSLLHIAALTAVVLRAIAACDTALHAVCLASLQAALLFFSCAALAFDSLRWPCRLPARCICCCSHELLQVAASNAFCHHCCWFLLPSCWCMLPLLLLPAMLLLNTAAIAGAHAHGQNELECQQACCCCVEEAATSLH